VSLKNINLDLYVNDFTFLINSRPFSCPAILAEILSDVVSDARRSDPTTDSIAFSLANYSDSILDSHIARLLRLDFPSQIDLSDTFLDLLAKSIDLFA
jgi:hypothetical protein